MSVDGETVEGFVVCHRLAVERRDVCDVAVKVNEVDVGILINGNEALDLFVPGNMGDVGVAQTVDFVVGGDRLVVHVILVQIVAGQYE